MQFKVPQFLEIEDKIFGPFTFRQFVYLVGGAGLCYILFKLLPFLLALIPMLAIAGLSLTLTFYRPNGKPFVDILQAGIKYALGDKLYVWERHKAARVVGKAPAPEKNKSEVMQRVGPKLSGSKLRDLAWSLDILDLKK